MHGRAAACAVELTLAVRVLLQSFERHTALMAGKDHFDAHCAFPFIVT